MVQKYVWYDTNKEYIIRAQKFQIISALWNTADPYPDPTIQTQQITSLNKENFYLITQITLVVLKTSNIRTCSKCI